MILALFIFLISSVLFAISYALGLITFSLPVEFSESLTNLFSYAGYLDAFVPVGTLMAVIGTLVGFYFAWYTLHLIFWVLRHMPFMKVRHPRGGIDDKN